MPTPIRTRVAIIGAGPAGLLLSHLLHLDGIDSIVIDNRTRADIEKTIRAGILENGTVDLLVETGASERVLTDGNRHEGIELQFQGEGHRIDFQKLVGRAVYLYPQHEVLIDLLVETGASTRVLTDGNRHEGIELQFQGEGHRIDFQKLVGRAVYLYPQHEVLIDLLARRIADGGDIRFEHEATDVDGTTETPRIIGKDAAGEPFEIVADVVIGADGSRSVARTAVVGSQTGGYFREYPFAWFGILCEAPPSSEELIYANSDHGFALISQRSATVQRMYLQCDPEQDPNEWSDAQIWDSLQTRVTGRDLKEGKIFQRDVLRFRSFVAHQLQKGRVFLVGDAAHTVPPTGAKGMNLAVNDVRILHEGLLELFTKNSTAGIDRYEERALHRIWRAQHFSWWMTSMLHSTPDASDFDRRRQIGELESVVSSEAAMTYLAEAYTGWPYGD